MKHPKIIQIGFNKCGTQSLHAFYEMHGFKSIDWDSGNLAARIKSNYLTGARILEGYEQYDFISDMEVTTEKTGLSWRTWIISRKWNVSTPRPNLF